MRHLFSRNINRISLIVVSCSILYCCSKKSEKNPTEIYNEKASEIINLVLADKQNSLCDCMMPIQEISFVKKRELIMPDRNTKKTVMNFLSIDNEDTFTDYVNLSSSFDFSETLKKSKYKILGEHTFDSITTFSNKRIVDSIVLQKCPKGFISISKPIFNKDFTLALLDVDGPSCIPSPLKIYTHDGTKWLKEENILFSYEQKAN